MNERAQKILIVGDVHGHIQLALCVAARWQEQLGISFEAVLLCGDVGTFTDDSQLDSTTRRHGKRNPCELEFLTQWSADPPAPWLDHIFTSLAEGGLGLTCPVIMVHGNHEGFAHLERIAPSDVPCAPVTPAKLPAVDTKDRLRLLPSGWRVALPCGVIVGGVGGIEEGQREAKYHRMAYLDPDAILALMDQQVDLLMTHQGPAATQAGKGACSLDPLLEVTTAQAWFHGHSIEQPEPVNAGPQGECRVVPLDDIAFPGRGPNADEPGDAGWCIVDVSENGISIEKKAPSFLREFRRNKWRSTPDGRLVSPSLVQTAWQELG
jgi:predicted phosphodiesterase